MKANELLKRLRNNFIDVKPLIRIELPENITDSRVCYSASIEGVQFYVGVFTADTDSDMEQREYTRFVCFAGENFTF